jgi:hypothetical protein
MKGMVVNTMHAVQAMDGDRVLGSHFAVPREQVLEKVEELRRAHGPGVRIEVDGRDFTQQAHVAPKPGPVATTASPRMNLPPGSELAGVELSHHMLWESLQRAAAIQAAMVDRMIGQSVEMTRRYTEQMEELRARYGAAIEKIDGVAFEQRMFEQERAYKHLAIQYRQTAEDERRAASKGDIGGMVEQLVVGAVRIINAIGDESINEDNRRAAKAAAKADDP